MGGIAVEPYYRDELADSESCTRGCVIGGFERGEAGGRDGEGQSEGMARKMNWPELHLMVFLSSRRGRVCLEGESRRQRPVVVGVGRWAWV